MKSETGPKVIFFQACWRGDTKAVKKYVDGGFDLHQISDSNYSAFEIAAKEKHVSLFEYLLENSAKKPRIKEDYLIKQMYRDGLSKGRVKTIKLMDEKLDCFSIDADIEYGWTPLMLASYNGHLELVEYLIGKIKKVKSQQKNIFISLSLAITEQKWDIVAFFLKFDFNFDQTDYSGRSLLMRIAELPDTNVPVTKIILQKGVNTNIQNDEGKTALMIAAGNSKGLKVEDAKKERKPIYDTHLETVRILLENKAKTELKDKNGNTAISFALYAGNYKVVQLLRKPDELIYKTITDKMKQFDLKIIFEEHVPIDNKIIKKRQEIIDSFKDTAQARIVILFSEILELLDNSPCNFRCDGFYGGDMFGGRDEKWEIFTKNLRIFREWRQAINESWQSIDVDIKETKISGFKAGSGIILSDDYNFSGWNEPVTILQVDEVFEDKIINLAKSLFKKVGYERLKHY